MKLRYEQSNLELMVILPEEGGMERALNRLAHEGTGWLGEFRWVDEVRLALPKLCMQSALDLKQIMLDMGCSLPFTLEADFSGMTGNKDLIIGAITEGAAGHRRSGHESGGRYSYHDGRRRRARG